MAKNRRLVLAACAAILAVGCATPTAKTDAQLAASAEPDLRQGEEVRNICFAQQIRSWRSLDSDSVIVETNGNKEYKLDLIGGCQPDRAVTSIGLISSTGGGSCVAQGDTLISDVRYTDGICRVRKIYRWNKDAAKPA